MVYDKDSVARMIDLNNIPYDHIGKLDFYLTPIAFQDDELRLSFSHRIGIENELTSRLDIACFDTNDNGNVKASYGFSCRTRPSSQAQRLMEYIHQNVSTASGPYKILSDNSHLDPCVTFHATKSSAQQSEERIIDQDSFVNNYRQTVEQVELAIANFFAMEDAYAD